MPPQDYIMRILWVTFIVFILGCFGAGEAVTLKRNGISKGSQQQNTAEVQDGLTRELRALPDAAESPAQASMKTVHEENVAAPKVGYDKAAMLFMKRYVDGLRKRSDETYKSNTLQKKSIYGPGMYPFYGMYGKRATEDPRFGYNSEVLDMIRGLIERTEAAASKERLIEQLRKQYADAKEGLTKADETKDSNADGKDKSEQVDQPKVVSNDNEDKAAKVMAFEAEADEKALEAMKDPVVPNEH